MVNQSREFLKVNLRLDKNIIQYFEQLKDIFPEVVCYSSEIYFLNLDFGGGRAALLQLIKLSEDVMTLYVHCYEPDDVFLEFTQWFFWIFSAKGEQLRQL